MKDLISRVCSCENLIRGIFLPQASYGKSVGPETGVGHSGTGQYKQEQQT